MKPTYAIVIAGLFLAACSGSTTSGNDGGSPDASSGGCVSARDCSSQPECASPKICVCSSNVCIPTCATNADCSSGQVCIEAVCSNPGCGGNADCTTGQVCVGGACQAPIAASQIHGCVISPDNADVQAGSTVQLSAVAQDSSGNALPFTGTTWTITGAATIDASTGLVTATTPAGLMQMGTATATMGAVSCSAPVNVYSTISASGSIRVVVIDQDTKAPVAGAYVVLGSDTAGALQTGTDGSVTFTGTTGTSHNVHAFAANHDYASYIGITGSDLLIPLRQFYPIANRSAFDGTVTAAQLNALDVVGDDVHVAFYGSGISGSLLDFNFDNILGQQRDVAVNVSTESFNLPGAPGGLILGLSEQLFTSTATTAPGYETSGYTMYADPGERILWGIGGNLDLATLLTIAEPLLNGGSIDVGKLLPQVLPLLGHLETGNIVGVEAGASGASPTPKNLSVTLDTPMHMNVAIKSPALPKFNGVYLDGAIAVTGAGAFPLGFMPLGVTAGLAATDSTGAKTGAILDPTCTVSASNTCATSTLPLSMATRNHGLENFPYGVGLIALNFSAITTSGATIAVAGKYATEQSIAFSGGSAAPTVIDLSATPYMNLPASTGSVSYSLASRTLTVTSDADASTQIYKFTLSSASHQSWSVYLPPAGGSAEAAVLVNPADVNASLVDIQATASSTAYIAAIATSSASNNYASLTGFGNVTVDALGNNLSAFAVQTIALGE